MRRWCSVPISFTQWHCGLRASGTLGSDALGKQVREALRRARSQGKSAWVPLSRVSSFLPDDTRERLAAVGGLAGYCKQQLQSPQNSLFAVRTVDGVLCIRATANESHVAKSPHVSSVKSMQANYSNELQSVLKLLPDRPASVETCRRAWELPSVEITVSRITKIMEQIQTVLRSCDAPNSLSLYIQAGYVGKLLSFVVKGLQGDAVAPAVDEPTWFEEDFSPQYDLWRLSRFLLTADYISVQEAQLQCGGILQTPLLQVIMTYPERISLKLGPALMPSDAVEGRLYISGEHTGKVHEILGIKFVLSREEVEQHLKPTKSRFSGLTDEELAQERVKLKDVPPLRRQKIRRTIVREEFRRLYPKGNPLLNPNVVALYIYDLMPPGVWVNNSTVRDTMLPNGGKGSMHVSVDFFDKFPHLFITQGITTTSVNVMRREQGMEDVVGDGEVWQGASFRDEEILLFIVSRLSNKPEDWCGTKAVGVLAAFLPRHVFKYMKLRGNVTDRLVNILQRYPEAFEVSLAEDTVSSTQPQQQKWMVKLHRSGIEKLGVRLANELQTNSAKVNDATT
ncbi:hypothetical protein ERJ75_001729100 [Trypanosoma vivax]|nr:hypothetical protein TRVL_00924 [Trypanosoma vivax]KAH8604168.1 hypothetical protein ERJ75_001729100 [Trypanosoma vivax]